MKEKIPKEVKVEILSRLGIRALFRMKCVCKEWRKLIEEDPCLPNMQLARASSRSEEEEEALILMSRYDGETTRLQLLLNDNMHNHDCCAKPLEQWFPGDRYGHRVYNSCNGLLCLSTYQGIREQVFVCNPLLGKQHGPFILPSTTTVVDPSLTGFSSYGLGFDSSIDKYKHRNRFDTAIVYASGALHWWIELDSHLHKLMSFDLAQEKFRNLPRQFTGLVEFVDMMKIHLMNS